MPLSSDSWGHTWWYIKEWVFSVAYKEIRYGLCWFICFSFFEQQKIELYVMDSGKSIRLSECNNILI